MFVTTSELVPLADIGRRMDRVSRRRPATATALPVDLAELFREQWTPMVRLGVLLVGDLGAAEDAVQDAFAALPNNPRLPSDHDALIAYLRGTVVNRCRSALRHRYVVFRSRAYAAPGPDAVDPSAAIDEDAATLAALKTLPRRQREVLVLRYWADMSHADIAEVLHVAVGTVKSAASRGLSALRIQLEEQ